MTRNKIDLTTDIGLAMLIAESEDGPYEPIAVVANLREAREAMEADWGRRVKAMEAGESPACPYVYTLWARNEHGDYVAIALVLG